MTAAATAAVQVVHADLKPENFLLAEPPTPGVIPRLKVPPLPHPLPRSFHTDVRVEPTTD